MDTQKTGVLIARTRRELGMTQKELAQRLSVSDRAVSKWERGAGFPDVSLLEPLSQVLGLTATELLRGERGEAVMDDNELIREGAKLAMIRVRGVIHRNLAGMILFAAFAGFVLGPMGLWDRLQTQVTDIDRVVDAYVYTATGERVDQTQIEVVGQWHQRWGEECWYEGRFAIPEVPKTCREDTRFLLSQRWDDYGNMEAAQIQLYTPGNFDIKTMKPAGYFAPSMEVFAVMTGEGKIIATDDYLARLMAMYPYVYRLDNVGITVWDG